jgi:hypothetical protein
MTFEKYYEQEYNKQIDNNLNEVLTPGSIGNERMNNFLRAFGPRYGLENREDVENLVRENEIAALFFCKDPKKQNISETTQLGYMEEHGYTLEKLPGNGGYWLLNAKMGSGKQEAGATKTIDYKFKNHYFCAKHTMGKGGAQDNQCKDVYHFLKEAKEYVEKNNDGLVFVALVDGNYYEKNIKKLEDLKSFECDRIKVFNSDTLLEYLLEEFPLG